MALASQLPCSERPNSHLSSTGSFPSESERDQVPLIFNKTTQRSLHSCHRFPSQLDLKASPLFGQRWWVSVYVTPRGFIQNHGSSQQPRIPSLSWPPSSSVPTIDTRSFAPLQKFSRVGSPLLWPSANISILTMPKFRSPDQTSLSQALYCTHISNCPPDLTTWMLHKPQNSNHPKVGVPPSFSPQCLASSYAVPKAGPSSVPPHSASCNQSGPQSHPSDLLMFEYS